MKTKGEGWAAMNRFIKGNCPLCGHKKQVYDGQYYRKIRESKEWSLRDLAIEMQITPSYLSDMERNRREMKEKYVNYYFNL